MNIKRNIKSLLLFGAVTILPILKIYSLGLHNIDAQSAYIRIYFWLQFLTPIIDFGYYWSGIRSKLEGNQLQRRQYEFSIFGFILAASFIYVDFIIALLLILATFTAWYNYRLQIFRIDGQTSNYYKLRLSKISIDFIFLLTLIYFSSVSVNNLLLLEIFAILISGLYFGRKGLMVNGFGFSYFGSLFTFNYLYTLIKVVKANFIRILIPIVFIESGFESLLFVILIYELAAQYLSIEKVKDLLDGKFNVSYLLLIYILSIPLQFYFILAISDFFDWNFNILEIISILVGGTARIFSVYGFRAIKLNGFNYVLFLNILMTLYGFALIYVFTMLIPGIIEPTWLLMCYYSVEFMVGYFVIITFEKNLRN